MAPQLVAFVAYEDRTPGEYLAYELNDWFKEAGV
jgi:hypothetical protein